MMWIKIRLKIVSLFAHLTETPLSARGPCALGVALQITSHQRYRDIFPVSQYESIFNPFVCNAIWFYLEGVGDVPINLCCSAPLWTLQCNIKFSQMLLFHPKLWHHANHSIALVDMKERKKVMAFVKLDWYEKEAHHKICLSFYHGGEVDDHNTVDHSHKRNNTGKSESDNKRMKVI